LSAAMLLPCATSSFAEEFANTGAAPPSRYATVPGTYSYGSTAAPYVANQYADPYSAYAASGIYGDLACQVSPGDPWARGFCQPVTITVPR
jgi:hypothetical protein